MHNVSLTHSSGHGVHYIGCINYWNASIGFEEVDSLTMHGNTKRKKLKGFSTD